MVKAYVDRKYAENRAQISDCNTPLKEAGYAVGNKAPGWLTYVVSAPLSNEGSMFFWKHTNYLGAIAAIVDVVYHVAIWLAILILDCWVANLPNRHADDEPHSIGDAFAQEIQWGATVCTILVWAGLVISIVLGFMGQIPGSAWPSTVSLLRGGAIGGIIFSSLYAIKIMGMVGTGSDDMHNNWNIVTVTPEITVRQMTLWVIGLKCLALATLDANLNFFGPVQKRELANICGFTEENFGMPNAWTGGEDGYGPRGTTLLGASLTVAGAEAGVKVGA